MLIHKKIGLLLSIILIGVSNYTHAVQTCLTVGEYPDEWLDGRYTNHADGTVTDTTTGLMWMQCSDGLSDATCSAGSINTYTWQNALGLPATVNGGAGFAGYTDWRLPNAEELGSLAANNCYAPAINETIFPVTSSLRYWSSSLYANDANNAWVVNFNLGERQSHARTNANPVRLVRSGQ